MLACITLDKYWSLYIAWVQSCCACNNEWVQHCCERRIVVLKYWSIPKLCKLTYKCPRTKTKKQNWFWQNRHHLALKTYHIRLNDGRQVEFQHSKVSILLPLYPNKIGVFIRSRLAPRYLYVLPHFVPAHVGDTRFLSEWLMQSDGCSIAVLAECHAPNVL
jgi:hypothetical protein